MTDEISPTFRDSGYWFKRLEEAHVKWVNCAADMLARELQPLDDEADEHARRILTDLAIRMFIDGCEAGQVEAQAQVIQIQSYAAAHGRVWTDTNLSLEAWNSAEDFYGPLSDGWDWADREHMPDPDG